MNSIDFALNTKPVSARDMILARTGNPAARSASTFEREMASLHEMFDKAKAGELEPINMEHGLAVTVSRAQLALHKSEPSYQDAQNIKSLKSVIGEIAGFLSGAEDTQEAKLKTWSADRQQIVTHLGNKVARNMKEAFEQGAGDGATVGDKSDAGIYSWKEFQQARSYLQRGFSQATGRGSEGGSGRPDLKTDIKEILNGLTTVADDGVEKWSGFSDIGLKLGSVLAQIAELEGKKFEGGAELLESYTESTGLIYGQIAKAGRELGKEFAEEKSGRADTINDLGDALGLHRAIP